MKLLPRLFLLFKLVSVLKAGTIPRQTPTKSYIIIFGSQTSASNDTVDIKNGIREITKRSGVEPIGVVDVAGFRAAQVNVPEDSVADIEALDGVEAVFPDGPIAGFSPVPMFGRERNLEAGRDDGPSRRYVSLPTDNWNLCRISNRQGGVDYVFTEPETRVYVLDTGVYCGHDEFDTPGGSKCELGANFVENEPHQDTHGHGTHIAGIIAGNTYGIARHARIISVKCLGQQNTGTWSGFLKAMDWVYKDSIARNATSRSVLNISLGAPTFPPADEAVRSLVSAGLTVVVAAGNDGVDTSGVSPAAEQSAVTVGALGRDDTRYGNYGESIDIFAPGVGIRSASREGRGLSIVMTGTSMAAPHVTGVFAYFISLFGAATPDSLKERLVSYATAGQIVDAGVGSKNRIVFNGAGVYY